MLRAVCQYIPSPTGFPLPRNIGNGHIHGLAPKICLQLSLSPISYWLTYGCPYLSRFSMVVLFSIASFRWNLRKAVIRIATIALKVKATMMSE